MAVQGDGACFDVGSSECGRTDVFEGILFAPLTPETEAAEELELPLFKSDASGEGSWPWI